MAAFNGGGRNMEKKYNDATALMQKYDPRRRLPSMFHEKLFSADEVVGNTGGLYC